MRIDSSKQIANLTEWWTTDPQQSNKQLEDCIFLQSANIEITCGIYTASPENKWKIVA
jgi:hypothetical protein